MEVVSRDPELHPELPAGLQPPGVEGLPAGPAERGCGVRVDPPGPALPGLPMTPQFYHPTPVLCRLSQTESSLTGSTNSNIFLSWTSCTLKTYSRETS